MDELTRLFLAARDGDRTALLHAVRASQADVWRLARHLVGPDEADDVTQDTFVRAWKALPSFRGDSSARTWLLVDRPARLRRRGAALGAPPADRRAGRAPGRGRRRSGRHRRSGRRARRSPTLIDELPRDQRAAFVLTQIVGCSYAEAAEACGVPVGHDPFAGGPRREHLVETLRASETG